MSRTGQRPTGSAGSALLILVGLAFAPIAAGQDALGAIDSCVRKLNAEADIGYERVAARCPELVRRLEDSGWAAWLPRDWNRPGNDLSAGSLRELRVLVARELASQTMGRTPRVERLSSVLAGLGQSGPERGGWWARTKEWLRDVFDRSEHRADDGWLTRLIAQSGISQAVIELMSYAALALVVGLAGLIVVNELRSGGVFGSKRERQAARVPVRAADRRAGLTWSDVERAAFRHKPRLLLELITARLTEESCLPPASGFTVRELTRAARLTDEKDRDRLAELALLSERVRFSDAQVSADDIGVAVQGGRQLLERIGVHASDRQSGTV
ncbi:MAG: hypothetical protein JWN85_1107 [Gammaproteobacteria bacterium]|nr:hypothetical protein [Gammaproteobacteria bacterium]